MTAFQDAHARLVSLANLPATEMMAELRKAWEAGFVLFPARPGPEQVGAVFITEKARLTPLHLEGWEYAATLNRRGVLASLMPPSYAWGSFLESEGGSAAVRSALDTIRQAAEAATFQSHEMTWLGDVPCTFCRAVSEGARVVGVQHGDQRSDCICCPACFLRVSCSGSAGKGSAL